MPSRRCLSGARNASNTANVEQSKKPRAMRGLHDSLSKYFSTTSAKRSVRIPAKFDEMLLMDYTRVAVSHPCRRRHHVRGPVKSPNRTTSQTKCIGTTEETGCSDSVTVCRSEPTTLGTPQQRPAFTGRAVSTSFIRSRPGRKRRTRPTDALTTSSSAGSILPNAEQPSTPAQPCTPRKPADHQSRTSSTLTSRKRVSQRVATRKDQGPPPIPEDSPKPRMRIARGRRRRVYHLKLEEAPAMVQEGRLGSAVKNKRPGKRLACQDVEAESDSAESLPFVGTGKRSSKRAKTQRRRYSRRRPNTTGRRKTGQKSDPLGGAANTALYRQVANLKVRPDDVELFNGSVALASSHCNHLNAANSEQVGLPYVIIGGVQIQAWCRAPYPAEYAAQEKLYICEFCLAYLKSKRTLLRHVYKCNIYGPPGKRIYRNDYLSVFEVNGGEHTVYCQNLCLLAKLFLDHKTLHSDVEPFLFYVLTRQDDKGYHLIGYFSKEKVCVKNYNLSCIMVLPNYQKMGYGSFLIDFSYLLSRRQMRVGTPERPLSELGRISYQSYWKKVALRELAAVGSEFNFAQVSKSTGILPSDLFEALRIAGAVVLRGDSFVLVRDMNKLKPSSIHFNSRLEMPSETEHLLDWECDHFDDSNEEPAEEDTSEEQRPPVETRCSKALRSERIRRKYARILLMRALKKLVPSSAYCVARLMRMVCGRVGLNAFFGFQDGTIWLKRTIKTRVPSDDECKPTDKVQRDTASLDAERTSAEQTRCSIHRGSLPAETAECSHLDDSGSRISQPQQSSSLNTMSSSTLSSFATSPPFVYSPPLQDAGTVQQHSVSTQVDGSAGDSTASPLTSPVVIESPQSSARGAAVLSISTVERQAEDPNRPDSRDKAEEKAEPVVFQRQRCLSGQPGLPSMRRLALDRRSTMPLSQPPLFDESAGNEVLRRPGTAPPIHYFYQGSCPSDRVTQDFFGVPATPNNCYYGLRSPQSALVRMSPLNASPRFRFCCTTDGQMVQRAPSPPRQFPFMSASFSNMPAGSMTPYPAADNGLQCVPAARIVVPANQLTGHELQLVDYAFMPTSPYAAGPYLAPQQCRLLAPMEPGHLLGKRANNGDLCWRTSAQQQGVYDYWSDVPSSAAQNYVPINEVNKFDEACSCLCDACRGGSVHFGGYGCLTPSLCRATNDSSFGFERSQSARFKSKPQFDASRKADNSRMDQQRAPSPMDRGSSPFFSPHVNFASAMPSSLFESNRGQHVLSSEYQPSPNHFFRSENSDSSASLHPLV